MNRPRPNRLFSAWNLFWIQLDFLRSTFCSRVSLWIQGCPPGPGFKTSGRCYFKARHKGDIQIGSKVILLAGHRSNRAGLTNPVLLETLGEGRITIGDGSGGSAIVLSSRAQIVIGQNVKLGVNTRVFDHDFHSLDAATRRTRADQAQLQGRPVHIGDDVFVGAHTMILKGVTIGPRAVIAAGAVVTKDVPADEVWGGNPARCLRAAPTGNPPTGSTP